MTIQFFNLVASFRSLQQNAAVELPASVEPLQLIQEALSCC